MSKTTMVLIAMTLLCSTASQIFQKKAALSGSPSEPILHKLGNINFIKGILLLGLGLLCWLFVLINTELSLAYPLLSLNYVLVIISARLFLHEAIPPHRWFGSAIIIVGVFVLSGSNH